MNVLKILSVPLLSRTLSITTKTITLTFYCSILVKNRYT